VSSAEIAVYGGFTGAYCSTLVLGKGE